MTITTSTPIIDGFTPATYADLQTWLADHLARSDLAAQIPMFIRDAENMLNFGMDVPVHPVPPLRSREMLNVLPLTPDADGICDLPADFLEYTRVVDAGSLRRRMSYITPDAADEMFPSGAAGTGQYFTIIGGNIYTYPKVSNDIELTFYELIPALADVGSNWLLARNPTLYLYAALPFAMRFIHAPEGEIASVFASAASIINGMNRQSMVAQYARATLMSRGLCP